MLIAMIMIFPAGIITSLMIEKRLRKRGVKIDDLALMSRIGAWHHRKDMTSEERWALFWIPAGVAVATLIIVEGIVIPLLDYYELF